MLTVFGLDQSTQWDEIVNSFADYDTYWLSGYVKAFQIHGDGEPLLFYYQDNGTRGINVVMKRDIAYDNKFKGKIPEKTYYDFSTPYGYGGWLIEGKETAALFREYNAWLIENGIVTEFVRFHPMIKNHETCNKYYDVLQLGEVVHMDLSSPDVIWSNFTSKNRNTIRKAIKNDISIYNGRFPDIFEKFQTIYNMTMDKDNADDYYYFEKQFYKSLLEDLPYNSQIFWAEKDETVIAASVMLSANGKINYHLSGSIKEFSSLAPTNLLLYHAALWGFANGYKTLYLGGGLGSGSDSLFKFKRAFNKNELNNYYIGRLIIDKEIYDHLCHCVKSKSHSSSLSEVVFFPEYRA